MTLNAMHPDIIVIRHQDSGACNLLSQKVNCAVLNAIGKQSGDIAMGVDATETKDVGAGDQGLMFGYATDESDALMPAPIYFSHLLVKKQADVRKNNTLPWLRPDAKSQLTFKYENGKPVSIDAVVLSTQHSPNVSLSDLKDGVIEEIILSLIHI